MVATRAAAARPRCGNTYGEWWIVPYLLNHSIDHRLETLLTVNFMLRIRSMPDWKHPRIRSNNDELNIYYIFTKIRRLMTSESSLVVVLTTVIINLSPDLMMIQFVRWHTNPSGAYARKEARKYCWLPS